MSDLTAETRAWQRRQENAGHASVLAVGSLLGLGANRLLRGAGADGKVGAALGGIAGTLLVFDRMIERGKCTGNETLEQAGWLPYRPGQRLLYAFDKPPWRR